MKKAGEQDTLTFKPSKDENVAPLFRNSRYKIMASIIAYNYEHIEGTDYYFIYKKCGGNGDRQDPTILNHAFRNMLYGDLRSVINNNEFSLLNKDTQSTIFWDVNNHVILVKGFDNLYKMIHELVIATYTSLGEKRTPELDKLADEATDVDLVDKIQRERSKRSGN